MVWPKLSRLSLLTATLLFCLDSYAPQIGRSWLFEIEAPAPVAVGYDITDSRIQEVMGTEKFVHRFEGTDDEVALHYLKVANAVTALYLRPKIDLDIAPTLEDKLILREGDCTEYSFFTYSNYRHLVWKAERLDLQGRVRIASGNANLEGSENGHDWLVILQDGEWRPYEVEDSWNSEQSIDPLFIEDEIKDAAVFIDGATYHPTQFYWWDNQDQRRSEAVATVSGVAGSVIASLRRAISSGQIELPLVDSQRVTR